MRTAMGGRTVLMMVHDGTVKEMRRRGGNGGGCSPSWRADIALHDLPTRTKTGT